MYERFDIFDEVEAGLAAFFCDHTFAQFLLAMLYYCVPP